jgi:hypothetical protein
MIHAATSMNIAVVFIVSMFLGLTFDDMKLLVVVLAQTDAVCVEFQTDYASCLVNQFDSQSDAALCDQCRIEYANALTNSSSSGLTCEDIELVECSAVLECPCGACDVALEAYLNCEVLNYNNSQCSAGINCRTSIVNCLNSFDEYRNCLYRLPLLNDTTQASTTANGKACDDCRIQVATNFSNGGSCDMAKSNFCTGVTETCAVVCGNCVDELDFYYTCDVFDKSNGNCQLDCGTVSTPPISEEPLCIDALTDFAVCVTDNIPTETERLACDTCRLEAEQSTLNLSILIDFSCNNIQDVICNEAVPTCANACGPCVATLTDFWICSTSIQTLVNCSSVACNLSPPPATQPGPTVTPRAPTRAPTVSVPSAPAIDGSPTSPTQPVAFPSLPVSQPTSSLPQEMLPTTSSAFAIMTYPNIFVSLFVSFLFHTIKRHV